MTSAPPVSRLSGIPATAWETAWDAASYAKVQDKNLKRAITPNVVLAETF